MNRQSTSLMRSTLAGLWLLVAACGGPVKKSDPSPFHQAAEPTRERDWPLDTEDDGGFVGDPEAESGGDDDDYEAGEDFDSYDDSEDDVGDSLLEDDDFAGEGLEDDDFEDDE